MSKTIKLALIYTLSYLGLIGLLVTLHFGWRASWPIDRYAGKLLPAYLAQMVH
jgi:hypothetical protein